MKRQLVLPAMAVALSLSAAGSLQAASPLAFPHAANDKQPSAKMVSFSMRNDSAVSFTVKAGDREVVLEPGKLVNLKLPEGQQILAVNSTPTIAAGSAVTTVTRDLQGSTLAVR